MVEIKSHKGLYFTKEVEEEQILDNESYQREEEEFRSPKCRAERIAKF